MINVSRTTIGSSRFIHYHKGEEEKAWQVYWTKYLFTENSNWKERYYSVDDFTEVSTYQNGVENFNYGPYDGVNGWGNTVNCMPERYWIFDDYSALTSSVDAKEVLAFNEITFKKARTFNSANDITNYFNSIYDLPVLEYEFPEEI